ncbi:ATP-dependent helicase [uncultured Clostridium sp.]|uniref:ATP-dependent helicase n=1 Tax=uncultured Clostridium sp. TaxID=59620 RepID=UPI0032180398
MQFNKEQLEVINHKKGACAVIAGAGSGKSTVLVERVRTLIDDGVDPNDIAVVTFTSNSSDDLKTKFKHKGINGVTVGTFHSICKRILISENVYMSGKIMPYNVENIFKKINKKVNYQEVMGFIAYQKNYNVGINDEFIYKECDYCEDDLREYYKAYEKYKTSRHALDFEDWLVLALNILKTKPNKYTFKYILVDEHQDSNLIQNDLISLLCPSGNVFCVFDYRQAIYTFRGGNPEYCMNFKKYYPKAKVINLDMNYRSTNNVVNNANNFISKYYGGYEFYKESNANNKIDGNIRTLTSIDKNSEAIKVVTEIKGKLLKGVKPNEISILYRNNSNSLYIENELKREGISYFISSTDGSYFNRNEIKCVMCMLRLIDNPHDDIAFETVLKTRVYPITFISKDTYETMIDLSATKNISLFEACDSVKVKASYERKGLDNFRDMILNLIMQHKKGLDLSTIINNILTMIRMEDYINDKYDGSQLEERIESIEALKTFVRSNTLESFLKFVYSSNKSQKKCTKDDIQLMTIHKSKGLEFDNVYLVGVEDGKFPSKKSPLEDEARLFYVAVTRPKNNLTISQIYEDNQFVNEYFK